MKEGHYFSYEKVTIYGDQLGFILLRNVFNSSETSGIYRVNTWFIIILLLSLSIHSTSSPLFLYSCFRTYFKVIFLCVCVLLNLFSVT